MCYTCCAEVALLEEDISRVDFTQSIPKYFAESIYNLGNKYFFHVVVWMFLCPSVSVK